MQISFSITKLCSFLCGVIGNIVTADQLALSIRNIDVFSEMLRNTTGDFR
jgi:hypothetical protein